VTVNSLEGDGEIAIAIENEGEIGIENESEIAIDIENESEIAIDCATGHMVYRSCQLHDLQVMSATWFTLLGLLPAGVKVGFDSVQRLHFVVAGFE
jgi:hypothetical protein